MEDWFDNLEQREQLFVGIGAIVVAIILFWGLIWMPLDKGHKYMRSSVDDWQRSLADLRVIGATMQSDADTNTATTQPGSNQSAVVIVDQTLS